MPDPLAVFFAAVFVAVVAGSVWLRGVRAVQAWVLVAGYVAVDIALLQIGRADFIGVLTRDPRYVTDALPIIAIGFCAAFTGPVVRRPRWAPQPAGTLNSALTGTAFLMASCLLSTFLLADEQQHRYSRNYVHGVVRALEENPGASVVSTPLPPNITVATDLDGVLRAVGREQQLDRPGTDVRMFDGLANLRPITVINQTLTARGPVKDCGWAVDGAWQRLGWVATAAPGPQVIRLGYLTGQQATLHLAVGDYEQALALQAGVGHATFVVTGEHGAVRARVADVAFGGLCVTDVTAGTPWPAD